MNYDDDDDNDGFTFNIDEMPLMQSIVDCTAPPPCHSQSRMQL